jgi:hypothetical protein
VKDVNAVEHAASPFYYNVDDPQGTLFPSEHFGTALTSVTDMIIPAVNRILSLLRTYSLCLDGFMV